MAHGADRPQAALWAARSGAIAALAAAQMLGMTFMVDQLFGRDRGGEWIRLAAGALCVVALVGAVALVFIGSAVAIWTGRRIGLAGAIHVAAGVFLGAIAWQAFEMVRDAGLKALWFVSVRPGRGLHGFGLAAALLVLLGLAELGIASWRRQRSRRSAGRSAPAPEPGAA